MGSWSLIAATPDIRPRNDVFGNFFAVRFRMKYSNSTFGSFSEMPRLEWKETITMIERGKGTWWQHVVDQYARDPNSQTFINWVSRYTNAFYCVRQQLYGPEEGVRLYDKQGATLGQNTFPQTNDNKTRADVVRNYLKSHGGIMEVLVVDKPGINKPQPGAAAADKERILTFDCGLSGGGARIKAIQHLKVNSAVPEGQWFRECTLGTISNPFNTMGLNRAQPPADVLIVKPFTGNAMQGTYQ